MATDPNLWSHENLPEMMFYLDPDEVIHFLVTLTEHERTTLSNLVASIFDLYDPDTIPLEYLPYLGNMVGVDVDMRDFDESVQRARVRSAVAWYKEKGKLSAFVLLFRTMGMTTEIFPLWIDENGEVEREPLGPGWKPHARIDLELREYPEWRRYLPEQFLYVLNRMEEVRPIHVLLREILLGWELFDHYDFGVEELDEDFLYAELRDYWVGLYWAHCGIWHFPEPIPDIFHNGAGYIWQANVLDLLSVPPGPPPSIGDRYLVSASPGGLWTGQANNVAEWDGAAWTFFTRQDTWALWVMNGATPGDHTWYHYAGGAWNVGGQLYDLPRVAPGPFFRECWGPGDTPGGGPYDTLEISTVQGDIDDDYYYCILHNGAITVRDGYHYHRCKGVYDELVVYMIPVSGYWDGGALWDGGNYWDP